MKTKPTKQNIARAIKGESLEREPDLHANFKRLHKAFMRCVSNQPKPMSYTYGTAYSATGKGGDRAANVTMIWTLDGETKDGENLYSAWQTSSSNCYASNGRPVAQKIGWAPMTYNEWKETLHLFSWDNPLEEKYELA